MTTDKYIVKLLREIACSLGLQGLKKERIDLNTTNENLAYMSLRLENLNVWPSQ